MRAMVFEKAKDLEGYRTSAFSKHSIKLACMFAHLLTLSKYHALVDRFLSSACSQK
jgi:hypothetical protein